MQPTYVRIVIGSEGASPSLRAFLGWRGGLITCPLPQYAVPATIIEKGILSDALVVDVVIKKYCEHLPFYRQAASILRDANVEMSQSTLSSSTLRVQFDPRVGELLKKVCLPMKADLLAGGYIQADETTAQVQSERTKGKNHQAYIWAYGRPFGPLVYDFRMGRGRGPRDR